MKFSCVSTVETPNKMSFYTPPELKKVYEEYASLLGILKHELLGNFVYDVAIGKIKPEDLPYPKMYKEYKSTGKVFMDDDLFIQFSRVLQIRQLNPQDLFRSYLELIKQQILVTA
jgi:hypothetical protein